MICDAIEYWIMVISISSIYVAEVRCLPPPTWYDSMLFNSSQTGYKAVVNYSCLTAPDQGPYITMCGKDALWNPPIKDCESMEKSSFLHCNSFNALVAIRLNIAFHLAQSFIMSCDE